MPCAVVLDVLARPACRAPRRRAMIGVVALAHRLGGEVGVRAGAVPVALHRLGVERGARRRSPRRCGTAASGRPTAGRATSSGLSGPIWNSHWPGMTSALMPEMPRPASRQLSRCASTIVAAEDLVGADAAVVAALRGREAAVREAERAAVLEERVLLLDAEQRLVLRRTSRRLGAAAARVLVGCGVMSVSRTSHITRTLSPPRIGSGHENTGWSTQSELSPGAWLVLEPSKPQIGRLARRRGRSWSSTAAWPSARCRRSRCTRPCRPPAAPVSRRRGRPASSPGSWPPSLEGGDFAAVCRHRPDEGQSPAVAQPPNLLT